MAKWKDYSAALYEDEPWIFLKIDIRIIQNYLPNICTRLQQYVNRELPDVQAGFRKGRGTRDQIAKHPLDHGKSKRVPEKHLLLLY